MPRKPYRILKRFYGETIERIETIVEVALDAMEHDAYWEVLERINQARETDVGSFAEALEQFQQALRLAPNDPQVLQNLEKLRANASTRSQQAGGLPQP